MEASWLTKMSVSPIFCLPVSVGLMDGPALEMRLGGDIISHWGCGATENLLWWRLGGNIQRNTLFYSLPAGSEKKGIGKSSQLLATIIRGRQARSMLGSVYG